MADGLVVVPPDSTGKKVDTSELTVGANTVERQRIVVADPATAVALGKVLNAAPTGTEYAQVVRNIPSGVQQTQLVDTDLTPITGAFRPKGRNGTRGIMFQHDFTHVSPSMYNDAVGSASRDCEVTFCGRPTARLDPQGVTTASTSPGMPTDTSGVIFKVRLTSLVGVANAGVYAHEGWMRMTSNNLTTNAYPSVALYNRDGTSSYHTKIWIDNVNDATHTLLKYLNSSAAWVQFGSYLQQIGHNYQLTSKLMDRAGGWNYYRLCADLTNLKYVSFQWNEVVYDLSAQNMYVTSSSAQTMLHFSVEFSQHTSTRRFINIADISGSQIG